MREERGQRGEDEGGKGGSKDGERGGVWIYLNEGNNYVLPILYLDPLMM